MSKNKISLAFICIFISIFNTSCANSRAGAFVDPSIENGIGFYDGFPNSCSLGCGCYWDISVPDDSIFIGHDTPSKPDSDEDVVISKSILIVAGSSIKFRIKDAPIDGIEFAGFTIVGGSWDEKYECDFPKDVVVKINNNILTRATLKNDNSSQMVLCPVRTLVKNTDCLEFMVNSGYGDNLIGITCLVPEGGH